MNKDNEVDTELDKETRFVQKHLPNSKPAEDDNQLLEAEDDLD